MITADDVRTIVRELGEQAAADIAWAEGLQPPTSPEDMAFEVIYVICNSGMRFTVARGIYDKVFAAIGGGGTAAAVFKHEGKSAAIDKIWRDRAEIFAAYKAADDKLAYCATLPWIGPITKFHVAKNFGVQVAKPDVHLQRLADLEATTAQALCERLSAETGYRVATIDTLLWRACAVGVMDSKTGSFRSAAAA